MTLLDYNKQRTVAVITIILAGLYNIKVFGIRNLLSGLMEYQIAGEINVASVIGIITIILAVLIYKRQLG